jgi:hypothetical protein
MFLVIYRGPAYKYKTIKEQDHVTVIPESDKLLQNTMGKKESTDTKKNNVSTFPLF